MGEKFKEHWHIAVITAFTMVLFTLAGQALYSAVVKVEKSATVGYVNEKHNEAKAYTDEEIKKQSQVDEAYRLGTQQQLDDIKKDTKFIKEWVLTKEK